MATVNDRAGAEEEERLEKTVREQVHDAGRDAANAKRNHHQAKLRNGRVSEDAFNVSLRDRDERSHERGNDTDPNDDSQRWRDAINRA
jgi:hypothetical protein